ncbi:hypothetical protein JCM5350_005162 [Sporobolomyces pararoseus]
MVSPVRSRSSAPIPPTPSPRKPLIPSPTPSSSHQPAPVDHHHQHRQESIFDLKPLISSKSPSPPRESPTTSSTSTSIYRKRSLAPEFEPTPPGWLRARIKLEKQEQEQASLSSTSTSSSDSRFQSFEREPSWLLETSRYDGRGGGGGGGGEVVGDRENDFETLDAKFGLKEEEQEVEEEEEEEEREIDYGDEGESVTGEINDSFVEEEDEEIEAKSDQESEFEEEDEPQRQRRSKRKRIRNGSSSIFKKRKRLSEKALEKIQRDQEIQDQAERELETSSFLDSLGVDPRPTLVSVKARLTNEVAAKTAHFPSPHQVLSVKEPPLQYPRPPSPPTLGRRRRQGSTLEPKRQASATPGIGGLPDFNENDDELEDYVEEEDLDQPPPEELIDSKPVLVEFEVVEEKPKKLQTKGEAILRWKQETNLLTNQARTIPDCYSWSSYQLDHQDLSSLSLDLISPLPPLLTLTRTLEAHQDLLDLRPPTSHTSLIWNSILNPEPPEIDSDSRQARANWQLSNFQDRIGIEKLVKQAEKEGILKKDFEMVAKEVFEFDGRRMNEWTLEKVQERNWLFAEQIVQLARIKKAYARLATPEVLDKLASTLKTKREEFERDTNKVKLERSSLPKTIGNSQWILKLGREIEELKIEYETTIIKVKRLEDNLRARYNGA